MFAAGNFSSVTTTEKRLSRIALQFIKDRLSHLLIIMQKKSLLVSLDGTKGIDEVFEDIKAVLAKFA